MTEILVAYYNILMNKGYYPKQWLKILDTILGNGKGIILGKLRTIGRFIVHYEKYLEDLKEEIIESDERFSKSNYELRKNLNKDSNIGKRLMFDNSILIRNLTLHHLTNSQSCYNKK